MPYGPVIVILVGWRPRSPFSFVVNIIRLLMIERSGGLKNITNTNNEFPTIVIFCAAAWNIERKAILGYSSISELHIIIYTG